MSLRLGIDLDGVVVDFVAGWIDRYNEEFGTELTPEQAPMWSAPAELGLFATMGDFWRWAARVPGGFFERMPAYPEAVPALHRLRDAGHRIVIVTSKPSWADAQTMRWIAASGVPTREIHITSDKYTVDCDVYLDDHDRNLIGLARHRPDAAVCRFVRTWNTPIEGTVDVAGWDAFVDLVQQLAEERAN